ncbi:hypothetical protein L6452_28689 [Arctium lappa]|uniref:Uncharacterized protein n=1 Tax=Arctium lappa TaxID=4217 RepID=A0ACB8ZZ51_ARCLA|nr:hypothetical protein L6452_28689 [Arctium lappa]
MAALKRLLRYLVDKDDYISTTGYVVYLDRNPISWISKKQRTIARSSTEAEYRAIASITAEVLWVLNLLTELGHQSVVQPSIFCDNTGATFVAANPKFHSKMKHLGLDYHFVRENVQNGTLRVSHISSKDQLADALTKPLPRTAFQTFVSKIDLHLRPSILRGDDKDKDCDHDTPYHIP